MASGTKGLIAAFARRRAASIVVPAAILAFVAVVPGVASADTTTTVTPFVFTVNNPCNGNEPVVLTGEQHTTFELGAGQAHITETTSTLEGQGTSGALYHGTFSSEQRIDLGPLPVSMTMDTKVRLESQTGLDNFNSQILTHITINANGEVTADVLNVNTDCNG